MVNKVLNFKVSGRNEGFNLSLDSRSETIKNQTDLQIKKAEELVKNNSEIYVVKKMIATLRMMGDVMSRAQTYMPEAQAMLDEAKKLNPDNPRVYVLEAQDKFYTPEQFGGSKEEAKVLFEKAQKLYETFKPETSIHPGWGKNQVAYFLSQYK